MDIVPAHSRVHWTRSARPVTPAEPASRESAGRGVMAERIIEGELLGRAQASPGLRGHPGEWVSPRLGVAAYLGNVSIREPRDARLDCYA